MQDKVDGNKLNENIEHCIGAATSQVPESLGGYPAGYRPMKKVNKSEYDMSGPG
jgi:hypothetical protein